MSNDLEIFHGFKGLPSHFRVVGEDSNFWMTKSLVCCPSLRTNGPTFFFIQIIQTYFHRHHTVTIVTTHSRVVVFPRKSIFLWSAQVMHSAALDALSRLGQLYESEFE